MKEQHPIDELFRRQLGEYELEAPMHLWPGIKQQRQGPSAMRLRSWLLCGLLSLALTGLVRSDGITPPAASHPVAEAAAEKIPRTNTEARERAATDRTNPSFSEETRTAPEEDPNDGGPKRSAFSEKQRKGSPRKPTAPDAVLPSGLPQTFLAVVPSSRSSQGAEVPEAEKSTEASPISREAFPEFLPINTLYFQLETEPIQDFIPGVRFLGERWYAGIDLAISQDWTQRTISPLSQEFQPYAQSREATESIRNAQSATLRLSLLSASGLALRSGIQVSRTLETFRQTSTEKTTSFIPRKDPTGQVIGMDTIIKFTEFTRQSENAFHAIDIPLLLGYEFSLGRFNIGVNAGALLNMAFFQKGKFLAPDGKKIIDFSSGIPDAYPAFKNRLGLGYYGGLTLTHPITPSLHFIAEPYFRVFPQSYTTRDYPLEQKYRNAGIFIGFRKLLGPYWMNLRP